MEFIYGALGVVLALGLFAFGVFVGWRIKGRMIEAARRSYAEEITEKEREELRAEHHIHALLQVTAFHYISPTESLASRKYWVRPVLAK